MFWRRHIIAISRLQLHQSYFFGLRVGTSDVLFGISRRGYNWYCIESSILGEDHDAVPYELHPVYGNLWDTIYSFMELSTVIHSLNTHSRAARVIIELEKQHTDFWLCHGFFVPPSCAL